MYKENNDDSLNLAVSYGISIFSFLLFLGIENCFAMESFAAEEEEGAARDRSSKFHRKMHVKKHTTTSLDPKEEEKLLRTGFERPMDFLRLLNGYLIPLQASSTHPSSLTVSSPMVGEFPYFNIVYRDKKTKEGTSQTLMKVSFIGVCSPDLCQEKNVSINPAIHSPSTFLPMTFTEPADTTFFNIFFSVIDSLLAGNAVQFYTGIDDEGTRKVVTMMTNGLALYLQYYPNALK